VILFILHLKKTLSLLQDLLRHSNNGLQCTYCVLIKNIHETNDVGFFDMFTYLVKDFNPLNTELNPSANNINNQLDATITVY